MSDDEAVPTGIQMQVGYLAQNQIHDQSKQR